MTGRPVPSTVSWPPDLGKPPELAWLPIDGLGVDPEYQRTIDSKASQKLIAKIAAEFSWLHFQAIVATPDGERRWLVIDGQHRTEAARRRGIEHVPAVVVVTADRREQALAFVSGNRDRMPVSAQELFRARLAAGDDDAAIVKSACDAAGITLLPYSVGLDYAPIGTTPAVGALLYCLKHHGEAALRAAVRAVARHGAKERGGLRSEFFIGASLYLNNGGAAAELDDRIKRLGGAAGLRKNSMGLGGGNSKAATIAASLARIGSGPRTVAGIDKARLMAGR